MTTLEYRKSTAEALGLIYTWESWWHPESDANQRDMVWDWLKEQKGIELDIEYNPEDKGWIFTIREYIVSSDKALYISEKDDSLFTATQKAWEQFNNK